MATMLGTLSACSIHGCRSGAVCILLGLTACESVFEPRPAEPGIRQLVVGNALANLDAAGMFVLDPPRSTRPVIPPTHAVTIALSVARQLNDLQTTPIPGATGWREFLEGGIGRTIDWNLVEPGSRQPLALHTFLEDRPDSLHPSIYNHWGGEYVVPLLLDGQEVGAIGVAAHTRVVVDAAGRFHGIVGGDFRPIRLRYGPGSWAVVPPEAAVKFTAQLFGARVSEVPYFLMPGHNVAAHQGNWVLRFERPIRVRRLADGRTLETATLYVSQYPSFTDFRIPSQVVPTALLMFVPADEQPEHEGVGDLSWPIRIDSPISLMEVEAVLP